MPSIEIRDAVKEFTLTASIPIYCNTDLVAAFMMAAEALAGQLPLDKIEASVDPLDPNKFIYQWTLVGGQKWKQQLRRDGQNMMETFHQVQGEWSDSKYPIHRAVRDAVKNLIYNFGLTELQYKRL